MAAGAVAGGNSRYESLGGRVRRGRFVYGATIGFFILCRRSLSTRRGAKTTSVGHNGPMGIRLGALFGWGIVIYAVVFLTWSAFGTYGFIEGYAPRVLALLVLIMVAVIAGRSLHAGIWSDILPYSLSWAALMAIFDAVMNLPLSGWELYADWNIWFGYMIVVVAPLLALYPRFSRFPLRSSA